LFDVAVSHRPMSNFRCPFTAASMTVESVRGERECGMAAINHKQDIAPHPIARSHHRYDDVAA